jgi:hypothetical protein
LIYDKTGSYTLPFLLAGVPPILGGLCLSIVYFVGDKKKPDPEMLITNGKLVLYKTTYLLNKHQISYGLK